MNLLPLLEGEQPAVWHVVIVKDPGDSPFPPIQSFLAMESEVAKAVKSFRQLKGAR